MSKYGRWVIMDAKEKVNIYQAMEWWGSDTGVIIHCRRESNRGKVEEVYILGAYGEYVHNGKIDYDYITDTGNGYGGTGKLYTLNYMTFKNNMIISVKHPDKINEVRKLPLWVFK